MTNAADIIAILRTGLKCIDAKWCDFGAADDDFSDGYEAALADCKDVARVALKKAHEEELSK